ncbi:hypothetical protein COV82_06790 [Candidatus Peregrinibacteria bacterium CG11_big_fil_rev_8_21_14_0_20_46_8]|nr:MAG: hypothetical protein COV82_06790 [Candidatus Peregrinibacteria bacterium CG11_big_fil_rev_8_21_14_0_20_46_8]
MKKLIWLLAGALLTVSLTAFAQADNSFTDQNTFDSWFRASANKMHNHEIMNGFPDGSFGPAKNVTRAEIALMFDKFASNVVEKPLFEEPVFCTLEARPGLVVVVRNVQGEAITEATFTIDDDEPFKESDAEGRYSLLHEGEGYFDVTISAEGHQPHFETVKLEQDVCHVITQNRTVLLVPEVGGE